MSDAVQVDVSLSVAVRPFASCAEFSALGEAVAALVHVKAIEVALPQFCDVRRVPYRWDPTALATRLALLQIDFESSLPDAN